MPSGLCLQLPSPQAGMKFPKHNDFAALCSSLHGKGNTSPNAALGSRSCLKGAPDMR